MKNAGYVEGFDELDKALAAFEPALRRKGTSKATREGAKVVAGRARQYAPVSSGDLEASIKVRALKRSRRSPMSGHGVAAGSKFKNPTVPWYAILIEFGTRVRHNANAKFLGLVESDPFLRSGLWDSESQVLGIFRATLTAFVRQFKGKE